MSMPEREVLKSSLNILNQVFKQWINIERRQSGLFKNRTGNWVRVGKKSEPDIGGWITRGIYIAKPIAIEVKQGNFRPGRIYGADKKRFISQCNYLREITSQGGVGFWINHPGMIYSVLAPVLIHGARVSLDQNNTVVVDYIHPVKIHSPELK